MAICSKKTEYGVTLTMCVEEAEALLQALRLIEVEEDADLSMVYCCLEGAMGE